MSPSVLIAVAEGSEEVEAVSTGNALRRGECEVTFASVSNDKTVTCAKKTRLVCDALLEEVAGNKFDFIALPGGEIRATGLVAYPNPTKRALKNEGLTCDITRTGVAGANNLANSKTLIKMLKDQQAREAWYGGICAAPALVFKPNDLFPTSGTCYPSFQGKIEGAKNVDGELSKHSPGIVFGDYSWIPGHPFARVWKARF